MSEIGKNQLAIGGREIDESGSNVDLVTDWR